MMSMRPWSRSRASRHQRVTRDGFALPAALMALVLIAALIAASLVVSAEELRAGRTDVASQRALTSAELGVERAIAGWDPRFNVSTPVGGTRVISAVADARGDSAVVTATRVHDRAFWIVARAMSSVDGRPIPARATIGAATRLLAPAVNLRAALAVGGAAVVVDATVDGRDSEGNACGDSDPAGVAGVAAPDTSRVCGADCAAGVPTGVLGDPPVAASAALTTDTTSVRALVRALENRATYTLAGGDLAPRPLVAEGRCAYADPLNWGDPAGGPCGDHVPVIRVTGSATLVAGSTGQGILLVDGSLDVAPGARFDGIVIVTNDVRVSGAGAELRGAVVALDADAADGSVIRDGGVVRFGRCAAARAVHGAARLTRTPERWWAELR